ncbi:hypothetical protein PINS_up000758 [Pythium insidiosum]|nr:hypothetical protein PINS_up000758 [Pythium insidiosum]
MEEKCLRNMSCKCRLCAGEDISMLLNITKSISSNIKYDDDGADTGGDAAAQPPPQPMSVVTNSPPLPAQQPPPQRRVARSGLPPAHLRRRAAAAAVQNSPQVSIAAPMSRDEPMEVSEDDAMVDAPPTEDVLLPPQSRMMMAPTAPQPMNTMVVPPPAPMTMAMQAPAPMAMTHATAQAPMSLPMEVNVEMDAAPPPPMYPSSMDLTIEAAPPATVAPTMGAGAIPSVDEVLSKISDKNWKVRKEAYEHVKAICEQPGVRTDDVSPILDLFPKMCEDANASAMEAGIQAVLAYTTKVEPFFKGIVSGVMKRVVDKGFASRPGTVKLCEELVMAFIEAGAADDTVAALIEGTKNKKPKVPPACVSSILEGLKAFGPRVIPIQTVKAALPTLCESTVNGVRPVALNVIAEIHRWTGPTLVQDIVSNLRQAQQTEYESLTKEIVPGQAQPTKFVRGSRPPTVATARGAVRNSAASGAAMAPGAIDPREFAETVNLLEKLPKTEFRAKLAHPKWSEKVEGLKIILDLVGSVPKLANGDYYELVNTLKILSNDSNVNIVAKSVEVLGVLADGLRKNFTQYARMMFPELMKKLSDKKSVILNAVNNTLDQFLQHSMTIDMMMDDIRINLDPGKSKAPQTRVQTLGFLTRCVEKRMVNLGDQALVNDFGAMVSSAIDDVDPSVRKAAVDSLVVLVKATDQTRLFLQGLLDDVSRKNPRAFKTIQQGLGVAGAGSAPSSRPSSAGSTGGRSVKSAGAPPAPEIPDIDMSEAPAQQSATSRSIPPKPRGPPSRFAKAADGPKPPAAQPRKPVASSSASNTAASSSEFTPFSISIAPEDAEPILLELNMPQWSAMSEGFGSAKWMERKAAIEQLEDFAKQNTAAMSVRVIEAMTVFLGKQVKDFKDSNINVLKSAFQAVGTFAESAATKFPRGVVCAVVPAAADKIGDRKAAETIRNMMLQFCEATSPSYVLGCLINHMTNVKAPLAHIEALLVISECVNDFGVSVCNPRMIIDYVKGGLGLESSNPKVRSGAISVLGVMYTQLGPALLPILDLGSWKPALASTVEAEFKKVGFDPAKATSGIKRQVKDDDGSAKSADPGALFGRVDISAQVTKELLADMKCEEDKAAWKKRLAAMESVQSICESAGCAIEFTKPVMELLKALKARLSDSNANLKVKAAQVIGVVASSIGPEVSKMSKLLGSALLSGVSDNKKNMQAASIDALHKWVRHNNQTSTTCVESLLPSVSEALMNPVGRAELLSWTAEHLRGCERLDLGCLVNPTIQCLMDKSSEARDKAQLVLTEVMKSVGKDFILSTGCRDIKPAQMRTLKPLIEKASESIASQCMNSSSPVQQPAAPQAIITSTQHDIQPATDAASVPVASSSIPSRLGRTSSLPSRLSGSKSQLARPGMSFRGPASDHVQTDEPSPTGPMLKMNTGKTSRLAKGQFSKWIFDPVSQSEMATRKGEIEVEWRPYLSPELHAKLFAPSVEKGMMDAMSDLMVCVTQQPQDIIAALDLVFKWITLRLVDNNVQALAKLLELLVKLFEFLKSVNYQLDDVEAAILLPYLLQESGQSKPRFRVRFRDVMRLVVEVYRSDNYIGYLTECFNTSKNMKSRCECIDVVEFIIKTYGVNAVGKRCIKEIGKFVTAHEKDLRESAINALITAFLKGDGDMDRFLRLTGVTSQQGIDLITTKIKYLPPGSFPESTSGHTAPLAPAFPVTSSASSFSARTPPRMPQALNGPEPMSVVKQAPATTGVYDVAQTHAGPHSFEDDDVVMATPSKDEPVSSDPTAVIKQLVFDPIDGLLTETREIVNEMTPAFSDGVDALKGLYTIIYEPANESEEHFLRFYMNDIAIKLCDCIQASFGDAKKPMCLVVLTLCLSTLHELVNAPAIECIQRYAVERILLEVSAKLLDQRFEDFANRSTLTSDEVEALSVERRRLAYIYKALNVTLGSATKRVKAGELYPSVINLLQRIVRNDVGDYNTRDGYNHLLKKDSLDQLIGRLLLRITQAQAEALNPFEGIDIFGVLMQMHSFFSTLPQNDLFAVQIANDNMRRALKMIADSLLSARQASFEASINDLPLTSPVRELLASMGCLRTTSLALTSSTISTSRTTSFDRQPTASSLETASERHNGRYSTAVEPSRVPDTQGDPISRRLFDAGPSTSAAPTTTAARSTSVNRFSSFRMKPSGLGGNSDPTARSSLTSSRDLNSPARPSGMRSTITSLGDFASDSSQSSATSSSTATSTMTRLLRERLEKVRKF